jgi:hypothetical protein
MKWVDDFIVSNPNSPFWNEEDFYRSIDKLKALDVKSICLGHFGCLTDENAKSFLDGTVAVYKQWMTAFSQNTNRIDDIPYLVEVIWAAVYSHIPDDVKTLMIPPLTEAVELAANAYAERTH